MNGSSGTMLSTEEQTTGVNIHNWELPPPQEVEEDGVVIAAKFSVWNMQHMNSSSLPKLYM